jgi:hypothetical protein
MMSFGLFSLPGLFYRSAYGTRQRSSAARGVSRIPQVCGRVELLGSNFAVFQGLFSEHKQTRHRRGRLVCSWACGQVQSKKMQKLVFRSALGPNQISFSHSQDPKRRSLGRNPALQQAHDLILANPLSYRPG